MAGKNGNRAEVREHGHNGHMTSQVAKETGFEPPTPISKDMIPPARVAEFQLTSPFALMKRFVEDMGGFFEGSEANHGAVMPRLSSPGLELFRRKARTVPADWSPLIEVKERDDQLIVRIDLPGMSKNGVKLEIQGGLLTIRGKRRRETNEGHERSHCSECNYGTFFRVIPLPDGIDPTAANATFHRGVLEIRIAASKRAGRAGHRIRVRS